MLYYADRLSPHIARSSEGYLICRGVPVARCGTQQYLPAELSLPGSDMIPVYRPEEEVFSPACMASFEGKPVTEDHPDIPEGVTAENIRRYQKGHAQNIRRGRGNQSAMLLADLVITDPDTIRRVRAGKREISCGYTYTLSPEEGRWVQREIRGNHIAIVDKGRAGPRVCIRDRKPSIPPQTQPTERRQNPMKKSLTKMLARMAKDGDVETVAEFIEEMLEPEDPTGETAAPAPAAAVAVAEPAAEPLPEAGEAEKAEEAPENRETQADESALADIVSRLDRLIELLAPAAADGLDPAGEKPEGEAAAEALAEAVRELLEEDIPADSGFLETEEQGDGERAADHMIRRAVRALKPIIQNLPENQRKPAADAAVKALCAACGDPVPAANPYAALSGAARKPDPADLGRRIIQSRNVNYKR